MAISLGIYPISRQTQLFFQFFSPKNTQSQDLPGEAPHRRGLARPHLRPDPERRRGRAQRPGAGPSGAAGRPGCRASDGRGVPGSTGGVPWRSLWIKDGEIYVLW